MEAEDARIEKLREGIAELETLASPPMSLDRLLSLASDPDAGADDLARAIERDPAITARVLRLANSAYYGFSRRIDSIDQAVMVVGFRSVRNLAACAAVAPVFSSETASIDAAGLWRHSCAVAEGARLVAAHQKADDGSAYAAGLLHDLGQVVLDEVTGGEYGRAVAKGGPAAEREALGVDHAWAGAVLSEQWRLSPVLVSAIRHHHDPAARGGEAARVAVAEWLASREGLGGAGDGPVGAEPGRDVLRGLGLDEVALDSIRSEFRERREAIDLLCRETTR